MNTGLSKRVISWYGDDFTGSTDALEALAPHLRSVLFLRQPDERFFSQFADYAAFGLAGSSRSESPEWMETRLAPAFEWLDSLKTSVCHYKVCSTFDSSPKVGNIGRAMEIGKRVFASQFVPLVVGAPSLKRYTIFGNLFAAVDGVVYRIDRHPTMKCHPVTPMSEADLRLHLKEQTDLRIGLMDTLQLDSPDACDQFRKLGKNFDSVLIDVANESALARAGRLLWNVDRQRFIAGSSGVEYSLIAFWQEEGWIGNVEPPTPAATDRIVVLSGSCSPVTQQQIEYAERNGFALIRLDARALGSGERASAVAEAAKRATLSALTNGRSVVLFTAASPQDRIASFSSQGEERRFRQELSMQAGKILNSVLDESGVTRLVVAGGDTSSHAGQQLGIDALTYVGPLAPGAPLCRTWSHLPHRQNLEIVFKGGQCGRANFFESVLNGSNNREN